MSQLGPQGMSQLWFRGMSQLGPRGMVMSLGVSQPMAGECRYMGGGVGLVERREMVNV